MRYRDIERRLDVLEQRSAIRNVAYAVAFADSDDIEVCGTGERMTALEFAERYPGGVVVRVVYRDLWEAL